MSIIYFIARTTIKLLLYSFTQWHVEGKENVPKQGPLIVVANHLNLVDPPLLGASLPRKINFMAKEELFQSRCSFLVRALGAFPVRRGKLDRAAIRNSMAVLSKDNVLGLFPEGKRSADGKIGDGELGAALLASRSGIPVLPVGISGSEHIKGIASIFKRPRINVIIGEPFTLSQEAGRISRDQLQNTSNIIMHRIAELLPHSYRGAYERQAPADKIEVAGRDGN